MRTRTPGGVGGVGVSSAPTRSRDRLLAALAGATSETALAVLLIELGLELSPEKTRIVNLKVAGEGFDFLGYHFRRLPVRHDPNRFYCACWPSQHAVVAARQRIRDLTPMERVGLPGDHGRTGDQSVP